MSLPTTDNPSDALLTCTRRAFFQQSRMGLGGIALASLLADDVRADQRETAPSPTAHKLTHFAPRAKNVIFLHMVGAPSHLDLFDPKPELNRLNGELVPDELWKDLRLAFIRQQPSLLGSPFQFSPCGESGIELSELLPNMRGVADELCMVRSMHTEHFNHAPAQLFFQTGFSRFGRPSLGSWVSYGLGSESSNLPAFVVLITGQIAGGGNSLWGSGFLPSVHQGVEFRSGGDPVLFLSNPKGVKDADRRRILDGIRHLNESQLVDVGDPEIATRINQYELAYRMQSAVPELMDTANETRQTHEMYGTEPGKASFANNCLLARRLVERGVRFVQLFDQGWDHHSNVYGNLIRKCSQVDQPIAALIRDLKQRGLLDETLVVWGAEFGRTPMKQDVENSGRPQDKVGRDHHKDAFSIWMAGGGLKRGYVLGKSDDIGFNVIEDPMHVNDFHATLLHLLGMNHKELTFKYQGLDMRITGVAGEVQHKVIA